MEGELGNALVTLGVVGETGDPAIAEVRLRRVFVNSRDETKDLEPAGLEALERARALRRR